MRFRDRKERERYMDSLEQQMEHQREQIQRTLDEMEGSGRRTALEKLRSSLPSLPGRTSVRDAGDREAAAAGPVEPTGFAEPVEEPSRRPWWRSMFGG
jgi:hypothetical protein